MLVKYENTLKHKYLQAVIQRSKSVSINIKKKKGGLKQIEKISFLFCLTVLLSKHKKTVQRT